MRKSAVIILLAAVTALRPVCAADSATTPAAPAPKTAQPSAAPAAVVGETVATVNGKEIKRKELDMAVQALLSRYSRGGRPVPEQQIPTLERTVLDDMISRSLVLEEGLKNVPPDLETKVSAQMDKMKAQMGGEEGLASALKESGVTEDDYIRRMRENIIIQGDIESVIAAQVKVSPEEIKAYYTNNRDKMKQPEMVRASHILIRVPADATDDVKAAKRAQIEAARSLIKGGEKFAERGQESLRRSRQRRQRRRSGAVRPRPDGPRIRGGGLFPENK